MADGILNPIEQLEADLDFEVYTKQEVDALLDEKADKSDTYTKTETDALLDDKADADAVYTKTETDTLLSAKADKSTTLAGYGITDAYTKTETDTLLNGKADADNVYTKTEIDTKIPNTVGSATKPVYVNGGVITECTYELNKTVPANAVFTDTTYSAGNGLNLSGTSFSAKAGANVTVDGNGINVNGSGVVASADSGLISGGTAYTELRPTLDGTWVKNAQTTAINLQKLEGGIEYLYALLSRQYDQLKKYINGNYYDYDTDTDSKYTKTVPQGAMPYASLEQIGGKTVVWNQLVQNGNFADSSGWNGSNLSVSNNTATVTDTTTSYIQLSLVLDKRLNIIKGHKYFIKAKVTSTSNKMAFLPSGGSDTSSGTVAPSADYNYCFFNPSNDYTNAPMTIRFSVTTSGTSETVTATVSNYMCIDLTLLYGSGNEPTTVEEFTAQFPAQYYSYNAGTLLSAGVTEVVSRSTNIFDYDNYKAIIQSLVYPVTRGTVAFSGNGFTVTATGNDAYTTYSKNVFTAIKPSVKYTLSATVDKGGGSLWLFGYNSVGGGTANNHINFASAGRHSVTITATSATVFLGYRFGVDTNGVAITFSDIQIEESATATDYKPHILATYPIPAEIRNLEGYGWSAGSVYNYIDYERKVFVQRVASVDLSTLTWGYGPSVGWSATLNAKNPADDDTVFNGISATLTPVTRNAQATAFSGGTDAGMVSVSGGKVYVGTGDIGIVPSGTLYYELATPIETDISAYLTDDGLIEVEAGGTLTFPNSNGDDYRIDVPSAETYMVDLQSALGE